MTNEELKRKIVEILEESQTPVEYDDGDCGQTYFPTNEDVAGALIAAGIGDVKETKFESDHYWRMWQGALVELERAEHRAEVAEDELARHKRALIIAGDKFISEVCNMRGEDISDKCDYKCDTCFYEYYLQQAEKELAEERKDDL